MSSNDFDPLRITRYYSPFQINSIHLKDIIYWLKINIDSKRNLHWYCTQYKINKKNLSAFFLFIYYLNKWAIEKTSTVYFRKFKKREILVEKLVITFFLIQYVILHFFIITDVIVTFSSGNFIRKLKFYFESIPFHLKLPVLQLNKSSSTLGE